MFYSLQIKYPWENSDYDGFEIFISGSKTKKKIGCSIFFLALMPGSGENKKKKRKCKSFLGASMVHRFTVYPLRKRQPFIFVRVCFLWEINLLWENNS